LIRRETLNWNLAFFLRGTLRIAAAMPSERPEAPALKAVQEAMEVVIPQSFFQ